MTGDIIIMNRVRMVLRSILAVVLGIYIFGAGYYYFHTYPGTTYRGHLYGDLTKEGLKEKLDSTETTDVVLNEEGYTETISGRTINYRHNYNTDGVKISSNFLLWPLELNKPHDLGEIPFEANYDENLLKERIAESGLVTQRTRIASVDAKVVKGDGEYTVAKEEYGNVLDMDSLYASVIKSVDSKKTDVDVKALNPYVLPKVFQDDKELQKEVEYKNRWKGTDIVIDYAGIEIPLIDWTTDSGFRTNKEEDFEEKNEENIDKIVTGLAEKYDTLYNERKFRNSHGDMITLDYGNFGYELDQEGLKSLIEENLFQGNKTVIEAPFLATGRDIGGDDEIGDTYIEIDLSTQQLWAYRNGVNILSTKIVTGKKNTPRETPTGVFQILGKSRDTVLSSNVPGDVYAVPVSYWMPFTNAGHGLHDATWNADFGGDIYEYSGSHGCVNMTYEDVAALFDEVDPGEPVVIYKSGLGPTGTLYSGE